jgi:hypothetical protein
VKRGAPLLLYRCNAFAAWLTPTACAAIKRKAKARPREPRAGDDFSEGPVFKALRAYGRRLSPCLTCPGVVKLHERAETPPPRRIAT